MMIILGGFLIFFGLVWIVIEAVLYFAMNSIGSSFGFEFPIWGFILTGVLGLLFLVLGIVLLLVGISRRKKKQAKALEVFNNGIPTRAKVTFVDKNYSMTVNDKPIYSIVEFSFTDHRGQVHVGRKDNVESDLVIRTQITVGSEVDIKYMANDPTTNILIIKDPSAVG